MGTPLSEIVDSRLQSRPPADLVSKDLVGAVDERGVHIQACKRPTHERFLQSESVVGSLYSQGFAPLSVTHHHRSSPGRSAHQFFRALVGMWWSCARRHMVLSWLSSLSDMFRGGPMPRDGTDGHPFGLLVGVVPGRLRLRILGFAPQEFESSEAFGIGDWSRRVQAQSLRKAAFSPSTAA